MEITDAIQNIKDAGGDPSKVDADALKVLASFELPTTDGLVSEEEANARAARDRKKAEAKAAKLEAQLAEMQEQLEATASSGSNDAEKQLSRLQKQLEATNAKLAEAEKAHDATRRQAALTAISNEVGWHDGVDAETRQVLLERRFAEFETDDLAIGDLVKPVVREFRDKNAALIDGSARSGTGLPVNPAAPQGGKKEVSLAGLQELGRSDPAKYNETMKTVWSGVESGNVVLVD